jgi:hypothetical protein
MKPKLYIIGALVLLLALVGFMVWDFFSGDSDNNNPYALDLNSLRSGDTSDCMYAETQQIKPLLSEIHGIATDSKGNIYICGKDSLEILDSAGKVLDSKGIGGTALCIHVDNKGTILLGMEDHVQVLNAEGNPGSNWKSPGPDAVITSITTSGPDLFVADAGNKIVYRYDYTGKIINKIGQKDPATGVPGFILPSPYFDVAIGTDDNLWVVNTGLHQLEKFTKEGKLLTSWGKASMEITGFCGCCNPSNIALLPGGAFVTSEKAIERIKIYDPQGNFVCLVALPSSFEEGTKGLDLAVGVHGEILVLDPVKNLIRKFTEKKKTS